MSASKENNLPGLQILRGLAALAVLCGHVLKEIGSSVPGAITHAGAAGVDVFFVISGFIMLHTSGKKAGRDGEAVKFLVRRVLRVAPLYWICTFALLFAKLLGLYTHKAVSFSAVLGSLFFLENGNTILEVGWTLNYEMYFYLIFAVCLFARSLRVAVAVLTAVVLLGILIGNILLVTFGFNFLANPISIEFCFGVLLAYAFPKLRLPGRLPLAPFALGVAGIAIAAALLANIASRNSQPFRFLAWGLPAVCLVVSLVNCSPVTSVSGRALLLIGDASYSLYLTHPFVVMALGRLLKFDGMRHVNPCLPLICAILVSVAVALFTYRFVENPICNLVRPRAARIANPASRRSALRLFHLFLRCVSALKPPARPGQPSPARILLLNPAHIGDIVISTSLLPVLKHAYPGCEIGFVTAGWSSGVVSNHPLVRYTHRIDHWRMSREALSLPRKILNHRSTRRRALKEIRALGYDIAINLHPGAIDLLDVSWRADIPVRAAFSKSVWAPFATLLADYPSDMHMRLQGDCQADLLRKLGISEISLAHRRSALAPATDRAAREATELLGGRNTEYVVVHIGAGAAFKELPSAFWHAVAADLSSNQTVVFTGRGRREYQNIAKALGGLKHCINACDLLSWEGFVEVIRGAQALYGVDSVAGHVAAAVGTKSISVYSGSAGVARWRPESKTAVVWTNPVSCSPCHLKRGCPEMKCLTGIQPHQLIDIPIALGAAR